MDLKDVLIQPIITEKSTQQVGRENKYSFLVAKAASKTQIKQAVEKFFRVKVKGVNIIIVRGKSRQILRSRKKSKKSDWKKAVVKLAEGQKITVFELPAPEEE